MAIMLLHTHLTPQLEACNKAGLGISCSHRVHSTLTILQQQVGLCHGNISAEKVLLWNNGDHDEALLSEQLSARHTNFV